MTVDLEGRAATVSQTDLRAPLSDGPLRLYVHSPWASAPIYYLPTAREMGVQLPVGRAVRARVSTKWAAWSTTSLFVWMCTSHESECNLAWMWYAESLGTLTRTVLNAPSLTHSPSHWLTLLPTENSTWTYTRGEDLTFVIERCSSDSLVLWIEGKAEDRYTVPLHCYMSSLWVFGESAVLLLEESETSSACIQTPETPSTSASEPSDRVTMTEPLHPSTTATYISAASTKAADEYLGSSTTADSLQTFPPYADTSNLSTTLVEHLGSTTTAERSDPSVPSTTMADLLNSSQDITLASPTTAAENSFSSATEAELLSSSPVVTEHLDQPTMTDGPWGTPPTAADSSGTLPTANDAWNTSSTVADYLILSTTVTEPLGLGSSKPGGGTSSSSPTASDNVESSTTQPSTVTQIIFTSTTTVEPSKPSTTTTVKPSKPSTTTTELIPVSATVSSWTTAAHLSSSTRSPTSTSTLPASSPITPTTVPELTTSRPTTSRSSTLPSAAASTTRGAWPPMPVPWTCHKKYEYILLPVRGDCSKYIVCYSGFSQRMNCPSTLVFNYWLQTCDWPENVDCSYINVRP